MIGHSIHKGKGENAVAKEKRSPDYAALKAKVQELSKGPKDKAAVEARIKKLSSAGIPPKKITLEEMIANKQEIIDRAQKHAEEYEQVD